MVKQLLWLRSFAPVRLTAGHREIALSCIGAGLCLLGTEALSRWILGQSAPWFVAPMGASAILVFVLPTSPLAQPWPLVAGNLVSTLIGIACRDWLGSSGEAAALACTLAIAAMFLLRCMHPPGGAAALTAVLGGPALESQGYLFAFWPVTANALLLLGLALLFHRLAGRPYPHRPPMQAQSHQTADPLPSERTGLNRSDLEQALAGFGEALDISRDDLEEILTRASLHAHRRKWGDVRCRDIMSRDVVHTHPQASLAQAWDLLAHHKIKALPVTDASRRLQGMVSLHDFFIGKGHAQPGQYPAMSTAGQIQDIMTRHVVSATPEQPIVELVNLFSDGGMHHMPVIDGEHRVVGMITQSDLVAALFNNNAWSS